MAKGLVMQNIGGATAATIFAAGAIFLLALVLGVWKYRQMATSPIRAATRRASGVSGREVNRKTM